MFQSLSVQRCNASDCLKLIRHPHNIFGGQCNVALKYFNVDITHQRTLTHIHIYTHMHTHTHTHIKKLLVNTYLLIRLSPSSSWKALLRENMKNTNRNLPLLHCVGLVKG